MGKVPRRSMTNSRQEIRVTAKNWYMQSWGLAGKIPSTGLEAPRSCITRVKFLLHGSLDLMSDYKLLNVLIDTNYLQKTGGGRKKETLT